MSLLTVVQNVCREVGLTVPSVAYASTNRQTLQIVQLATRAGQRLAKKDWTVLQKEYTFSTVASTASYALPSDYDRMIINTAWDRTSYWKLRGQLSPREWQVKKSALIASTTLRSNFRVKPDTRVNKFYIDPTPSAVESMVYEYISNAWVKNAANDDAFAKYTADDDVAIIPEELIELEVIWRLLNRKGFAYTEEKDEAERAIAEMFAQDRAVPVLNFGAPQQALAERLNLPEGGFGS